MFTFRFLLLLFSFIGANLAVSSAYTEDENLSYINKILNLLNNNDECQLPSYQEIDELQISFDELESLHGPSFLNKLTDDQKLVRDTVLDQWKSFQKRMTSAVVIRSAKRRSFLCRIERYQETKFGSSICTEMKSVPSPAFDHIFEKNPLVRYIKHCKTHEVCDPDEDRSNTEVIHTPITNQDISDIRTVELQTPGDEKADEELEVDSNPAINLDTILSGGDEMSNQIPSDEQKLANSNGEVAGSLNNSESQLENHKTTTKVEELNKDAEVELDPLVSIPIPTVENHSEDKNVYSDSTIFPESPKTEDDIIKQSPDDVKGKLAEEHVPMPKAHVVEETTNNPQVPIEPVRFEGFEYVEDNVDEQDLNRLNWIEPVEEDFDWNYGYFTWPDEKRSQKYKTNDSIDNQWTDLLIKPYVFTEIVQNNVEPPQETINLDQKPEAKKRNIKNRKKEFFKSLLDEAEARKQNELFGWHNRPVPIPKADRWTFVADNNFCKITYNRDYIGKMSGVVAVKSFFKNSDYSKKKSLMG